VAFVLSGGANLGAAQAGMLEALLGAGIVPDLLVGTSIGAVNAAFMAAGPSADRARALSDVWRRLSAEEFFPLHAAQVTRAILAGGLFSPAPLRRMLEREIPFRLIEEAATPLRIVATRCERRADGPHSLRSMAAGLDRRAGQVAVPLRLAVERLDRTVETAGIPLRIVATAFERRAEEVFAAGPVLDALLASSALPLVFPPHRINGNVYVDGALSEYVPLLPALEAGARTIYVLSLRSAAAQGAAQGEDVAGDDHHRRGGVYRSLGNRFWRRESMTAAQAQAAHPTVRVVELPGLSVRPGLRDFSHLGDLIEQARHEAEAFLAQGAIGPAA
jgi:predicted acylesterase/phospholipase RssA